MVQGVQALANPCVSDFAKSDMATTAIMEAVGITNNTMPSLMSQDIQIQGNEDFVTTVLYVNNLPAIRIYLRGPHDFMQDTTKAYRSVFMVTGFQTGADSTTLLGMQPQTVYLAYDYPYNQNQIAEDPAKILQAFRVTPSQIALSLKWLSVQPWNRFQDEVAVGVSMGGLFLPSGLHIAMKMNAAPNHTVFAFTGSNLQTIIGNVLSTKASQIPSLAIDALSLVVPAINTLNDPALHLPYLQGSFLVVHSDQDEIIPEDTTVELYNLLPSQKQEVLLHGPHIDINQKALIDETGQAILDWLK
jgi:hypothetical protein